MLDRRTSSAKNRKNFQFLMHLNQTMLFKIPYQLYEYYPNNNKCITLNITSILHKHNQMEETKKIKNLSFCIAKIVDDRTAIQTSWRHAAKEKTENLSTMRDNTTFHFCYTNIPFTF